MFKNNNLSITKYDFDRLIALLDKINNSASNSDFNLINKFKKEIIKAKKVKPASIASDFVTMNSIVELKGLEISSTYKFKLVFPDETSTDNGNLSILSPIGMSVFGYREGDVIKHESTAGEKYYQISKVIYQSEANSDYHL